MRTAACEYVGRSRPGGPSDALLTMAANPRIPIHFTPTSGLWLNLFEIWFGIIERHRKPTVKTTPVAVHK
jgi:hypothetical protein